MYDQNPILQAISRWFKRNFSDPEALGLFFTLLIGFLLIQFFGKFLMPVLISIILAYLLLSCVDQLERWRVPHWLAVWIVYLFFLGVFLFVIIGLLPMLWKQMVGLLHEAPEWVTKSQTWITDWMHQYPLIFSSDVLQELMGFLKEQSLKVGHWVVTISLSTIPSIIEVILYVILVPVLVFFFLKDGRLIAAWFAQYLPKRRSLMSTVWSRAQQIIAVYVRARVLEIIIAGGVSTIIFAILGLQYAVLLGALVGLSVIVPYVGAVVVTIPVMAVGLMQWGLTTHFVYLVIAYSAIIAIDGNVLVPILFSESMELHPTVVILAVLIFGGIWGFWGIFFAIPLAAFGKVILEAWPTSRNVPPA